MTIVTKNIRLGSHYQNLIDRANNSKTVTDYGYRLTHITSYVCIYKTRLEIYPNGSAKAVTRVEKNYHAPYQTTVYFDKDGREIIDNNNNTCKELAYFKSIGGGKYGCLVQDDEDKGGAVLG